MAKTLEPTHPRLYRWCPVTFHFISFSNVVEMEFNSLSRPKIAAVVVVVLVVVVVVDVVVVAIVVAAVAVVLAVVVVVAAALVIVISGFARPGEWQS